MEDAAPGRNPSVKYERVEHFAALVRCYSDRQAAGRGDIVLSVGPNSCHGGRISVIKPTSTFSWRVNFDLQIAPKPPPPQAGEGRVGAEQCTPPGRQTAMTDVLNCDPLAEGSASPLELTILMPCLNEAETISICVAKAKSFLERAGIAGEVLIADNGSSDGSVALAQRDGARVIAVAERGYGAALRAGVAAARGRFVVMGDADDSYDFSGLDPFIAKLRAGSDLVMGNRFAGGIAPGAMPFLHRYLGNPLLSFIGRVFFRAKIGDFHCGLRGFRRDAILGLNLRTSGMELASEMVGRAPGVKVNIAEVPTTLAVDGRSRAPHLRTWHDGWRHLRFLLMFSPRWLFLYPVIVRAALGALGDARLFPGPLMLTPDFGFDDHTFLVAALAILFAPPLFGFAPLPLPFPPSH